MKELICVVCPNSCRLTVNQSEQDLEVNGNLCPRGVEFAANELTCAMRSLSSTVRTIFLHAPVVPVKTDRDIPKNRLFDAIAELSCVLIDKPAQCGDILLENILNTGANIVLTSDLIKDGDPHE